MVRATNGAAVRTSAPSAGQFLYAAVAAVARFPLNPRRTFDQARLDELTESIRAKGVLEPLLVRPAEGYVVEAGKHSGRPGFFILKPAYARDGAYPGETPFFVKRAEAERALPTWELIAGERRLRAAIAAGLDQVPVVVRAYTDQEAVEISVIENEQRADVPPLEKALGYQRLMKDYGYSAEKLAAKIGKSEAHVHETVKLIRLPRLTHELVADGTLPRSHAILIARVPSEAQRERLAKEIVYSRGGAGVWVCSYRDAKQKADAYTRELKGAPFDPEDAALVPRAGACTTCPFKSGNNRSEYPDGRADVCNNTSCFEQKVEAQRRRHLDEYARRGAVVLTADENKKVFPYGDNPDYGGPYLDLSSMCYEHPNNFTYKRLVGAHVQLYVGVGKKTGAIVELARRAEVKTALREHCGLDPDGPSRSAPSRQQVENRLKNQGRANAVPGILGQVADECRLKAKGGFAVAFDRALRLVLSAVLNAFDNDALRLVAKRRGLLAQDKEKKKGRYERTYQRFSEVLRKQLDGMSGPELFGLLAECSVARRLHTWKMGYDVGLTSDPGLKEILAAAGVDLKAEEAKEVRALKDKRRARAKKASTNGAGKSRPKPSSNGHRVKRLMK